MRPWISPLSSEALALWCCHSALFSVVPYPEGGHLAFNAACFFPLRRLRLILGRLQPAWNTQQLAVSLAFSLGQIILSVGLNHKSDLAQRRMNGICILFVWGEWNGFKVSLSPSLAVLTARGGSSNRAGGSVLARDLLCCHSENCAKLFTPRCLVWLHQVT